MLVGFMIGLLSSGLGPQSEALAGATLKLYYEENAQVELISPEGSRVLIDVHDPGALSSPPTAKDVLLTTHNHGDHRRLDFVSSFPGQQLDVKIGEIKLKDATIRGIASAHNEGYEFRDEGGSNYIFIVDMAGLRIAHFGDIGQEALTPEQLKILGKVDIAITQLSNMWSGMSAENKKGFNLMDQLQPKLIIPTHIHDPACAKIASDKWNGYESYKKYLSLSTDKLPEATTIIFMGRNANFIKLPYSNL
jgi:L-ascorbate metabolism protein UlaG (beta-lactamase superfamily)